MTDVCGYTTFEDFLLSCEKFGVFADTKDLHELGSGYVLYFDFLKYCAIMMMIYFVICQLPIMTYVTHPGAPGTDTWTHVMVNLYKWQNPDGTIDENTLPAVSPNKA